MITRRSLLQILPAPLIAKALPAPALAFHKDAFTLACDPGTITCTEIWTTDFDPKQLAKWWHQGVDEVNLFGDAIRKVDEMLWELAARGRFVGFGVPQNTLRIRLTRVGDPLSAGVYVSAEWAFQSLGWDWSYHAWCPFCQIRHHL